MVTFLSSNFTLNFIQDKHKPLHKIRKATEQTFMLSPGWHTVNFTTTKASIFSAEPFDFHKFDLSKRDTEKKKIGELRYLSSPNLHQLPNSQTCLILCIMKESYSWSIFMYVKPSDLVFSGKVSFKLIPSFVVCKSILYLPKNCHCFFFLVFMSC